MPADTPIFIDDTNYSHFFAPQTQQHGIWLYDGYLYIALSPEPFIGGGVTTIRTYRKLYGSPADTPWSEVDSANHPTTWQPIGVWFDGSSSIRFVHYYNSTLYLIDFDLTGPSWGSTISSLSQTVSQFLFLRGVGSSTYVYYRDRATDQRAYVVKYDGSWGTPQHVSTNLSAGQDVTNMQMEYDDNGLLHFFWAVQGGTTLYHRSFDTSTDTLNSVNTVTSNLADSPGPAVVWGDYLAIAYRDYVAFWDLTSGSPSWSEQYIDTSGKYGNNSDDHFLVVRGGVLYFWWTDEYELRYATLASVGSSWSSSTVWYDWEVGGEYYSSDGSTLVPWDSTNYIHNMSVADINNSWEILFGGYVDNTYSVAFYLPQTAPEEEALPFAYFGRSISCGSEGTAYGIKA